MLWAAVGENSGSLPLTLPVTNVIRAWCAPAYKDQGMPLRTDPGSYICSLMPRYSYGRWDTVRNHAKFGR